MKGRGVDSHFHTSLSGKPAEPAAGVSSRVCIAPILLKKAIYLMDRDFLSPWAGLLKANATGPPRLRLHQRGAILTVLRFATAFTGTCYSQSQFSGFAAPSIEMYCLPACIRMSAIE
jgi:hypothetical protein